jgi:hypothetical protein
MAFGFNLRQTSGYVTDPAGTASITSSPQTRYSTTKTIASVDYSVGYDGTYPYLDFGTIEGNTRDRDSGVDARLAGCFQCSNDSAARIIVTLPEAGLYDIRLACGDALYEKTQYIRIYDSGTLLATVASNVTSAAGSFLDANGVSRTAANWSANNTARQLDFSTTTCSIEYGAGDGTSSGSSSALSHIHFTKVAPTHGISAIDNPIPAGSSFNFTKFGMGTITSITSNRSGATLSSITNTSAMLAGWVNAGPYPELPSTVQFTFGDGTLSANAISNISIPSGYTKVSVASPEIVDTTYFAAAVLAQTGRTIATGDRIYHSVFTKAGGGIDGLFSMAADTGISSDPLGGTFTAWLWVSAGADAGKMYRYEVTVAAGGDVIISATKFNGSTIKGSLLAGSILKGKLL